MLMAVAAVDIGKPRGATNRGAKIGKGRPLTDPATPLGASHAREDLLEMTHQEIGAMPGGRLVRRGELDGAGKPQTLLHGRDEKAAPGRAHWQIEAHIVRRQHDMV